MFGIADLGDSGSESFQFVSYKSWWHTAAFVTASCMQRVGGRPNGKDINASNYRVISHWQMDRRVKEPLHEIFCRLGVKWCVGSNFEYWIIECDYSDWFNIGTYGCLQAIGHYRSVFSSSSSAIAERRRCRENCGKKWKTVPGRLI